MYAVILAGGGGTRLWPLSRPERPKPFLPLIGERTLLQRTWDRIVPDLVAAGDVAVVTDRRYVDIVREQLPELGEDMLLAEPVGRNTAAAVALAATALDRPDDDVMLVLPADHLVADEPGFRDILRAAASLAGREAPVGGAGRLVTLGIAPDGPETGYGYIVAGEAIPGAEGAVVVSRFVEKPSADAAEAMLAGPTPVAWNAGIFLWRRDALRAAFEAGSPDILADVEAGVAAGPAGIEAAYARVRATSIDYAVLEPAAAAGRVAMLSAAVGWSDLGSWSALRDALAAAAHGAVTDGPEGVVGRGPRSDLGSERTLVLAADRPIVTIGLRDIIVVDAGDVILVAAAAASQEVKVAAEAWATRPTAPPDERRRSRVRAPVVGPSSQPLRTRRRDSPGGNVSSPQHGRDHMATIIPRWEWRTFGPSFGAAEERIPGLTPTGIQESDEVYLLNDAGATVKVRFDLMDIKTLVETDAHGLEQWRPVMKAAFPLAAADVRAVFDTLGLPAPALAREAYTIEELIADLGGPGGPFRAVDVHKRRVRYTIGGCTSEVTDVTADGIPTRTIAIESTDAAAVVEAVRWMGLADYVNTPYGKGLARLLAGTPPRYAVIDTGTNSIKFHVGERAADGTWRAVVDRAEVTRLGEGLEQSGEISDEAVARAAEAIAGMVAEAKAHGALAITAVGTAGLRIAGNRDAVIAAIAARTGVRIEVISGEEESRLAYLAVKAGVGLAEGSLAVFDTGGGSTQLTFGQGERVDERFSVDVGAVRYTEQFGLGGVVTPEVMREAMGAIAADLVRLDGRTPVDALVGMGGAITNITAVKHALAVYDPDVVQGTVLDRAEIDRQIELYRTRTAEERRSIVGLQPKRADVILAGAAIVRTVMDKLGRSELTVSDRGLRHGLLVERFGR